MAMRRQILQQPNFSALSQFVNPADRVTQATGAGGIFDMQVKRMQQEEAMQNQLAQQDIANAQAREKLDLSQSAENRALEKLGDEQALQARRDFTQSSISPILDKATTDKGAARKMLFEANQAGGFSPTVQEQKILYDALNDPVVEEKPITGTVTIQSPDGKRYSSVPYQTLSDWENKGWKVGKPFKDGTGSGSKGGKDGNLWAVTKDSTGLDLDFFGSGDTDTARKVGQKLQDGFGLKVPQVTQMIQQSVGGLIDKSVEEDKLATSITNAGLTKNVFYEDAKTGETKPITATDMAKGFMNPDVDIVTNPDGSRIFINTKERDKRLRKYNKSKSNRANKALFTDTEQAPVTLPNFLP